MPQKPSSPGYRGFLHTQKPTQAVWWQPPAGHLSAPPNALPAFTTLFYPEHQPLEPAPTALLAPASKWAQPRGAQQEPGEQEERSLALTPSPSLPAVAAAAWTPQLWGNLSRLHTPHSRHQALTVRLSGLRRQQLLLQPLPRHVTCLFPNSGHTFVRAPRGSNSATSLLPRSWLAREGHAGEPLETRRRELRLSPQAGAL